MQTYDQYKFKGTNGSCGFMNGAVYNLDVRLGGYNGRPHLIIDDLHRPGLHVPYESLDSFLANWEPQNQCPRLKHSLRRSIISRIPIWLF